MSSPPDSTMQTRLFKALEDPSRYPHPVDRVERIDTHISCVLLAGNRAYKLKKAVDFGFLDFSTLERRRHFCEEELRLNRRLAPMLYRRVATVTGSPEDPWIDGPGEVIEYAVEMNRFDQADLLPAVLDRGALGPDLIDRLARRVARFHRHCRRAPASGHHGRPERILGHMMDNFPPVESVPLETSSAKTLGQLKSWTLAQARRLEPLLESRRQDGFIRECHGDMHLGNLCLIDGEPVAFDGIEFDPDLYWIDVISEIAFLTMDLDERGAHGLSARFLDRYLQQTGDYGGLALLSWYRCYRAMVRAKVCALTAAGTADPDRQQALRAESRGYLQWAEAETRTRPAMLVITHGLSGSGKSTAAQRLVDALGFIRLRSDVERKRMVGLGPNQVSHSPVDGGLYRPEMTRLTYRRLEALADEILDHSLPVVVDASFLDVASRQPLAALARAHRVPFRILSLQADPAVLRQRLVDRRRRGGDASEAGPEILERQLTRPHGLEPEERNLAIIVDTGHEGDGEAWIQELAAILAPPDARPANA